MTSCVKKLTLEAQWIKSITVHPYISWPPINDIKVMTNKYWLTLKCTYFEAYSTGCAICKQAVRKIIRAVRKIIGAQTWCAMAGAQITWLLSFLCVSCYHIHINLYLIIRYKSIIYKFCKWSERDCSHHFLCERPRTRFAVGPPPITVDPPPDRLSLLSRVKQIDRRRPRQQQATLTMTLQPWCSIGPSAP